MNSRSWIQRFSVELPASSIRSESGAVPLPIALPVLVPLPIPVPVPVPVPVPESPPLSPAVAESRPLSSPVAEIHLRSSSEPPPEIPPIISEEEDFSMFDNAEHYEYMNLDLDATCSICLMTMAEPFMDDPDVTLEQVEENCRGMPCGHPFHKFCIYPWLKKSPTCPVCWRTWSDVEAGQ